MSNTICFLNESRLQIQQRQQQHLCLKVPNIYNLQFQKVSPPIYKIFSSIRSQKWSNIQSTERPLLTSIFCNTKFKCLKCVRMHKIYHYTGIFIFMWTPAYWSRSLFIYHEVFYVKLITISKTPGIWRYLMNPKRSSLLYLTSIQGSFGRICLNPC